jgi:hypothetical protein
MDNQKRPPSSLNNDRENKDSVENSDQHQNPDTTNSPLQRMQRILSNSSEGEVDNWDNLLNELPDNSQNNLENTSTEDQQDLAPGKQAAEPGSEPPGNTMLQQSPPDPESSESTAPTPYDSEEKISKVDELAQSMRDRGYILEEDATGEMRLSGKPIRRGSKTSIMSASELVQLAAEMEGGILPPEERIHCPHCDAVIKPEDTRCPWCSKEIKSSPDAET